MKKTIAIILIVLIILTLFSIRQLLHIPVIGRISGAENDRITIGEEMYEIDISSAVSRKDRGGYIGAVTNGKIKMRVYETSDTDHIYALWGWEGAIYTKVK